MWRFLLVSTIVFMALTGCVGSNGTMPERDNSALVRTANTASILRRLQIVNPIHAAVHCEYETASVFRYRPWWTFVLECPLEEASVDPVAIVEFGDEKEPNRFMLWSARDRTIYSLFPDGTWESYPDTWSEGQPVFPCNPLEGTPTSPPLPKRGFGKVWCNVADVQSRMGFTYTEERLCEEAVIQDFAHGALVACIEPNGVRYARLLVDGTWQMGVESRTRSRVPSNIAAIPSYLLELLEALACLAAAGGQDATNLASGAWEPKGLNIVDLVGSVPEEHLRKAMVVWSGEGAVQYVSGERDGDTVTVNALIFTKELEGVSYANCLGQWAHLDQWASAMPAGRVRLYAAGREITDQVGSIEYYPAAQARPDHGTERNRYNRTPQVPPTFDAAGALELAANTGCVIAIPGSYPELTAVFTLDHPPQTRLTHTGEEEFVFQTYVGVGEAGALDSLRNQLVERFGDRHDKFMLSPPNDTDYLFVNFPPTPVSAYGNGPLTNPSSGTYRLGEGDSILSTDHLISMGLPLLGQWRDADQSRSAPFLPQIGPIDTLTAPEYFVPPGIQYDPCMTEGDCPNDLLDAIYASKMAMTVYYYRITRIDETLQPFPLRLAGPGYDVAATDWSDWTPATDGICGWFDADGRMLDYSLGSTYDASGTEEAAKP